MKFELNSLPRNCSNEEIIAEIKRVDVLVNKNTLTQKDFDLYGKIWSGTLSKRFGSWQKVLSLAGLESKFSQSRSFRQQRGRKATDDQILAELDRISKVLGKEYVTKEDWRNYSEIGHDSTVEHRFGSWSLALKKAGLKVSPKGQRYSQEDYFENLLNVWTHLGRQPSLDEMNKPPSKISGAAYVKRFGSWRKALEAFVVRINQEEKGTEVVTKAGKINEVKQEIAKRPKIIKVKPLILNGSRREIGLSLRYKVLSRDKFKCVRCGASPATSHSCRLHIDHKIPFSKGGRTALENLQTLCEDCNLGKGNRHLE